MYQTPAPCYFVIPMSGWAESVIGDTWGRGVVYSVFTISHVNTSQ